MHLSPKQLKVRQFAYSDKTLCLCGGATRSGKSFSISQSFGDYVLMYPDKDHCIAGWSIESIMRNLGVDLMGHFEDRGFGCKLSRTVGTKIVVATDATKDTNIWIIGANDARGQKRVQGSTLAGICVDEAVGLPESLWNMLWTRLTFEYSKMWASYNPDIPTHWFKTQIEDKHESLNGVWYPFSFEDNPSLHEEVKERLRNTLKGHWYKRLVEGLWFGASGLVYPEWYMGVQKLAANKRTTFALDWGVASVTAALRVEHDKQNANVVDEYYYDARDADPLSDAEHARRFADWAGNLGARVIVDPSTSPSFKGMLRRAGYQVVNARNRVSPGLRHTDDLLSNKRILIGSTLRNLHKELNTYSWDTMAAEREDKVVKKDDHVVDALRYFAYTTFTDSLNIAISTREAGF